MKTISSHPGAGLFRSTIVLVLILILILTFFLATQKLTRQAEEIAKDQVLVEIKQALSMMLYDYAIKGRLAELSKFEDGNPFSPLQTYRQLPQNYHGTVRSEKEIKVNGWYFDSTNRTVIYKYSDNETPNLNFGLEFRFDDLNGDGRHNPEEVGYLLIEKKPD